jgi:vitamin B12 transporter
MWDINDSFTVKNNYFRSFRFPEFEELYWSGGTGAGNPDLKPENGWGGDFGAEWRYNRLLVLDSVFFAQWLSDSIHWYAGPGGRWRPENVGKSMYFGLDNNIGLDIPVSIGPVTKISPSLSYKYLRSYLLGFGYTFASNIRIPYNPQHIIGGSLDISWGTASTKQGSLLLSGHYEGLRYTDRANLTKLEPYFLLNATVNQEITRNITAFASLRNILNQSYESYSDYPMPGINLTIGMRLRFDIE